MSCNERRPVAANLTGKWEEKSLAMQVSQVGTYVETKRFFNMLNSKEQKAKSYRIIIVLLKKGVFLNEYYW